MSGKFNLTGIMGVAIVSVPGYEYAITDSKLGAVTIMVRKPGDPWPEGFEPRPGTEMAIPPDKKAYLVNISDPDNTPSDKGSISVWKPSNN